MTTVSVLIPTFRRPDSFVRAARSVFAQLGVAHVELIAVDNSPEGSALATFEALSKEAPIPFRWSHAPLPGVAQARNAALMLARGDLIAWLDDDEEATSTWLASLIAVRRATGAQSVFGPVHAYAAQGARTRTFFERLYSRLGPARSGVTPHTYGIGNSLQPRRMFDGGAPFDSRADQRGGEDDMLFASWREAGATFAWAADAVVIEHLGVERTKLAHGLKRSFAYGQGPCETAWNDHRHLTLVRHMCVGALQAMMFGVLSAVTAPISRNLALEMLGRAARGVGKVLWFREQRFYGEALIAQPA